jgi:hypothetical protein
LQFRAVAPGRWQCRIEVKVKSIVELQIAVCDIDHVHAVVSFGAHLAHRVQHGKLAVAHSLAELLVGRRRPG